MTTRALYRDAIPLLLSRRAAAHLLGIDRCGEPFRELLRAKRLRLVPAGASLRVPLEDVQRVAREGFSITGRPSRARVVQKPVTGADAAARIRAIEVEP